MATPSRSKEADISKNAPDTLKRRFERRVRLSWVALLAERGFEALLWPFVVICAFLVFSLLGGWSLLPRLVHQILLALFLIGFVVSLVPVWRLAVPTRNEALRRLERDSGIEHRPASSYEDTLDAAPGTAPAQLWALHRKRLARLVARLRPSWPKPRSDRDDPYAIRAALVLALVAAFFAAGGDAGSRIKAAFLPSATASTQLVRLDAWITPPVYTSMAPVVLADGTEQVGHGAETFRALSVPVRSQLIVRAHAPDGDRVTLALEDEEGQTRTVEPKDGSAAGLVEFNAGLLSTATADLRIGGSTVAQWHLSTIEDAPPQINLSQAPTSMPRGALRIEYSAVDDYGVASAEARFKLANGDMSPLPDDISIEDQQDRAEVEPLFAPPKVALQLPRNNAKKLDGRATQDLTAHPWAGLNVIMTLSARDQADQEGTSEPYPLVLPERRFTKPLARAVIEQRRALVVAPDQAKRVARALDALTLGGDKATDDTLVYLSLRNSFWRLVGDRSRDTVKSVVDQLWDTALRIEEGDLPAAERDLRTAQDALMQALRDNAPAEEIKKRIEELREALSRYMQALASQQNEQTDIAGQPQNNQDEMITEQDLDKMLESIKDLAESGSKEMAEQMLSELNDILDRLQANNTPRSEQQQQAQEMMRDLDEVASDQQELMDDTFAEKRKQRQGQGEGRSQNQQFDMSQPGSPMGFGNQMSPMTDQMPQGGQLGARAQGQSGRQGDAPGGGQEQLSQQPQQQGSQQGSLEERQRALREKLDQLIERMRQAGGEPPEQFGEASEAMEEAERAIGERSFDRAAQNQSLALDRMREGTESMAQQMVAQGEMEGGQGPGSNGRDPLGRPDRSNRPDLGLSVSVPDEIDVQKAREVLDELRRRLGDPNRSTIELDYLERLIRSF
ncbi:MAG: TIGR02302 family protein [Methyloceanibacter sp.]|nr:TIGR02302 family protein [Methyloceanibacter sp.]